jgi:DNA-binding transcriptional MerR regulator
MPADLPIGALAASAGVNTKTIRYEQINLLPQPRRTPAGHRRYDETDAERISFIKAAQRLGLALDEIRQILALRDRGRQPCDYVRDVLHRKVSRLERQIAELTRLRDQLTALDQRADAPAEGESGTCRLIERADDLPGFGTVDALCPISGTEFRAAGRLEPG